MMWEMFGHFIQCSWKGKKTREKKNRGQGQVNRYVRSGQVRYARFGKRMEERLKGASRSDSDSRASVWKAKGPKKGIQGTAPSGTACKVAGCGLQAGASDV